MNLWFYTYLIASIHCDLCLSWHSGCPLLSSDLVLTICSIYLGKVSDLHLSQPVSTSPAQFWNLCFTPVTLWSWFSVSAALPSAPVSAFCPISACQRLNLIPLALCLCLSSSKWMFSEWMNDWMNVSSPQLSHSTFVFLNLSPDFWEPYFFFIYI